MPIVIAPGASARGNTISMVLRYSAIARESKRHAGSIMPVELRNTESVISRFKDDNSNGVAVSNFSLAFLAKVHVDRDAGGPGFLVKIERFLDMTEW